MNRYDEARELELSLLARGRGLIDGGVELDCFGEDRKAFTLNGESFIKPSKSPEGQHVKPYRRYQLALPKTYVTRRGQMVLFTSPEDMIVGQSVTLQHRKEVTSATAARRLKTVNRLVTSSMEYEATKPQSSEVGEFTPVYLQRLREAAERAKEAENYEAQSLDKDENMEPDDLEAADSGMGASLHPSSSGRLSSLSHYSSEGTAVHIIPGERLTEEKEEDATDPLKLLAGELADHMPSGQRVKAKSKGVKKRKTTSEKATTAPKPKSSKPKAKKRKRTKKPSQKDGGMASQESSKVKSSSRASEIEMKRREKRELERQRDEEARERERLQADLKKLRGGTGDGSESGSMEGTEGVRGECVAMANGGNRTTTTTTTTITAEQRASGGVCHRERDNAKGRGQTEAEKAQRAREAHAKGAKLREKSNQNNQLELHSLRHSQAITPAYTFSYFQYVAPRRAEKSATGGTAKGNRRGQQNKKQRPPKQ